MKRKNRIGLGWCYHIIISRIFSFTRAYERNGFWRINLPNRQERPLAADKYSNFFFLFFIGYCAWNRNWAGALSNRPMEGEMNYDVFQHIDIFGVLKKSKKNIIDKSFIPRNNALFICCIKWMVVLWKICGKCVPHKLLLYLYFLKLLLSRKTYSTPPLTPPSLFLHVIKSCFLR